MRLRFLLLTATLGLLAAACSDSTTGGGSDAGSDVGTTGCGGAVCDANETCSAASGTPTCVCATGYQDQDGDGTCAPACASGTCSGHGACVDTTGAAVCTCSGGYVGAACATCGTGLQDNDGDGMCAPTCTSATCSGRGTCVDSTGTATCTCDVGYGGNDCSDCGTGLQDRDGDGICRAACDPTRCNGRGVCDDASGTATCTCMGGYTGTTCGGCGAGLQDNDGDGVCLAVCTGATCSGHGSCSDGSGTATCTCTGGYIGGSCATCAAGTQDNDGDGQCTASCAAGTCSGHGTCSDATGATACTCTGGYVGASCASCDTGLQDNDADGLCTAVCTGTTCSGHGTCDDGSGTATCTCTGSYVGASCASCDTGLQDNDGDGQCTASCASGTCSGHGTCSDATGATVCTCTGNYVGASCASCDAGLQDNDADGDCTASCAGGACGTFTSCDDTSGTAACACLATYQDNDGDGDCTPDCSVTTCGADSACQDGTGVALCVCDSGFQDNDENGTCLPTCAFTCTTNATCSDASGVAMCTCDDGYQDNDGNDTCLPACSAASCGRSATCSDTAGTVSCACAAGTSDEDGDGNCSPPCSAYGGIPNAWGTAVDNPGNAFDGNVNTQYNAVTNGSPGFTYDYGSNPQLLRSMTMYQYGWSSSAVFSFVIAGSQDAITWNNLVTVNTTLPNGAPPKRITFANDTAYRYYSIYYTNTASGFIRVQEIVPNTCE